MKTWHRGTCNQIQGKVVKSNSWFTHLNFSIWVINEAFLEQLNNLYIFTVDQTHIEEASFAIMTHWWEISDSVFSDFNFHLDGILLECRQILWNKPWRNTCYLQDFIFSHYQCFFSYIACANLSLIINYTGIFTSLRTQINFVPKVTLITDISLCQ